jgi:hypothetical protein
MEQTDHRPKKFHGGEGMAMRSTDEGRYGNPDDL